MSEEQLRRLLNELIRAQDRVTRFDGYQWEHREAIAERNYLRNEILGRLAAAEQRAERLEAALKALEYGIKVEIGGHVFHHCPACDFTLDIGHADDCLLAAALADNKGD